YGLQAETRDIFTEDSLDPVYQVKARILNDALQEIGMGKYQVSDSDNLWLVCAIFMSRVLVCLLLSSYIVTGLILTPVVNEFNVLGQWLKLAQNLGLLVGAAFRSLSSDVWDREVWWAFNITLGMTGLFAIAAGGLMNYVALCSLTAVWSVGVGGNLPVDSAVFLEFIPASHQYLTVLSVWWAFGQPLGSLVAWPLIYDYSCPTTVPPPPCPRSSNEGWRYFLFAMGGLMMFFWVIRFFVFNLYENPKYLMGRGRDEQAVEVIHKVAAYNGKTSSLTLEELQRAGKLADAAVDDDIHMNTSALAAVRKKMQVSSLTHVKPLFVTRKMALSTTVLIIIWALIGLAFPLYNGFVTYFLVTRGANFGDSYTYITHCNQVILSVIGVPGALMAGYLVKLPYLGRRGTLAMFTILTGVFILASTTARTSNALLGWNCAYSYTSNIMYGVLYALSLELFPTKDRGTGNVIVASTNRVFGIMAPIIALYANLAMSVPIWISGAILIAAGFIALLLPFEPRGHASL
ncbi:MFS general substrate transporter, partial [Suillus cothurnatus]